jgi:hypothetical protein
VYTSPPHVPHAPSIHFLSIWSHGQ